MWLPKPIAKYIDNHFGSKRLLLKTLKYQILGNFGAYRHYDFGYLDFKPKRYVFICMGNICRSPLAAEMARHYGYNSDSFGLDTRGGDQADIRAVEFSIEKGIDLSKHRTKSSGSFQFESDDLIIAMEPRHIEMYERLGVDHPIVLLGTATKPKSFFISDPYCCNSTFFRRCEESIIFYTEALIDNESLK